MEGRLDKKTNINYTLHSIITNGKTEKYKLIKIRGGYVIFKIRRDVPKIVTSFHV